jgi:hypothetical protein
MFGSFLGSNVSIANMAMRTASGGGPDFTNAFIFTVDTGATDTFVIPKVAGQTYDYVAYFDGTSSASTTDADHTLTFPSGVGTTGAVSIVGTFPRIYFNNSGDKLKLTGITQFGDVGWGTNWTRAFQGCNSLTTSIPSLPTGIQIGALAFSNATNITGTLPALPASLIDGQFFFTNLSKVTGSIPSIPIGVTSAREMFSGCSSLDGTIPDLSSNDGTLTNVNRMFRNCSSLTGNSEQFWNWTTPPTTTAEAYTNCTSLTDYATIPAAYGGGGA